jgi:hypothetical protein
MQKEMMGKGRMTRGKRDVCPYASADGDLDLSAQPPALGEYTRGWYGRRSVGRFGMEA